MGTLELGQKLDDDLAFAAHGPEAEHGLVRGRPVAACCERQDSDRDERRRPSPREAGAGRAHFDAVSQPPENPARSRPRRRCGFFSITRQISALRWFSIIAQMGP